MSSFFRTLILCLFAIFAFGMFGCDDPSNGHDVDPSDSDNPTDTDDSTDTETETEPDTDTGTDTIYKTMWKCLICD